MPEARETLREWLRRVLRIGAETGEAGKEYLQRQKQAMSLRGDIRRAQAKKQDLYDLMGRKVYALHKRDKVRNKDLLGLCEQVDEQNAAIARCEENIRQLQAEARKEREIVVEDESPVAEPEEEHEEEPEEAAGETEEEPEEEEAPEAEAEEPEAEESEREEQA